MRLLNLFKRRHIAIITMPDAMFDAMRLNNDLGKWSKKLSKDYHVLIYPSKQSQDVEIEIYK